MTDRLITMNCNKPLLSKRFILILIGGMSSAPERFAPPYNLKTTVCRLLNNGLVRISSTPSSGYAFKVVGSL